MSEAVKNPNHYAGVYKFEVYQIIEHILNIYYKDATPYECFQVGNQIKYRLRAGFKMYDGLDAVQSGSRDIEKAIRCKEMAERSLKMDKVFGVEQTPCETRSEATEEADYGK